MIGKQGEKPRYETTQKDGWVMEERVGIIKCYVWYKTESFKQRKIFS